MRISDWSSDVCSSDLRDQILALLDLPDMRLRRGLYLGEFGLKRDDAFLGRGRIAEPGRSHRRHPRLCDAVSRKAQRHREHRGERRLRLAADAEPAQIAPVVQDKIACGEESPEPGAPVRVGRRRHRVQYSPRSEEHTSELQSLMRIPYAVS